MGQYRKRLVVISSHQPVLCPHVHLSFNALRQAWVVLAPEHVYWPDDTSVSILQRCDGERNVDTIITELANEYSAPVEVIAPDVMEFLQTWADTQLIMEAGN